MYAEGGAEKKRRAQMSCSIATFIRNTDPELYSMFEDTCLVGALTSAFHVNGITFLNPVKGSSLRKELERFYEEDREQLEKSLRSLILQDVFSNASDFKRSEQDIPNRLNRSVPLLEATGNTVKLGRTESPLTITKSSEFAPFTGRRNIAIWDITAGTSFLDDPKFVMSKGMFNQKKRKGEGHVDGGGEKITAATQDERMEYFKTILKQAGTPAGLDAYIAHIYLHMFTRNALAKELVIPDESLKLIALVADNTGIGALWALLEPAKSSGYYVLSNEEFRALKNNPMPCTLATCKKDKLKHAIQKHRDMLFGGDNAYQQAMLTVQAAVNERKSDGLDVLDAIDGALGALDSKIVDGNTKAILDTYYGGYGVFKKWILSASAAVSYIEQLGDGTEAANVLGAAFPGDNYKTEAGRYTKTEIIKKETHPRIAASITRLLTDMMQGVASGLVKIGGSESSSIDGMLDALESI